jgi:ATP-dependent Clp protease ATP-binding subunit ClpC
VFERFTDRARRVVVLAQEEARMMSHNYIGTEHLLLGLLHDGDDAAAIALGELGVELGVVRAFVEEAVGRGGETPGGHIPFTPRAKKVLELSLRESLQLQHNFIGTEHILLGLVRCGEGLAVEALMDAGADLESVRRGVLALLGRGPRRRQQETYVRGPSLTERLVQIQESLERIERHLGLSRPAEPPQREPGANPAEEPSTRDTGDHHPEKPPTRDTGTHHPEEPSTRDAGAHHPEEEAPGSASG